MTTALRKAFKKAAELPERQQDNFASFLLERLEFLDAVQEGLDAADRGEGSSPAEVRKMIPTWISKSSSRGRR